MGVNTEIKLPHNVRVSDVADVMGALAGLKPKKSMFNDAKGGWSTKVDGVAVEPSPIPEMVSIVFRTDSGNRHVYYHFETDDPDYVVLNPPSTAFWIAIGVGLVKFFGGKVDYVDSDLVSVDFERKPKSNFQNRPSDGEKWYDLQTRMLNVKPLTQKDFDEAEEFAAYKKDRGLC